MRYNYDTENLIYSKIDFKLMFQDYFGFAVLKQKHHRREISTVQRRTQLSNEKLIRQRSRCSSRDSAFSLRKKSYDQLDFVKSTHSNNRNADLSQMRENKRSRKLSDRRSISKRSSNSQFNCFTQNRNSKDCLIARKNLRPNYFNIQASGKQNFAPYQKRQQYSNSKSQMPYNFYRDDLKEVNNYQFRMKQYYRYNDKGDQMIPNKKMKASMEQRLRGKFKLVEQKSKTSKGIQLFQESKVRTKSQYYVIQTPTSQKQNSINNLSRGTPSMHVIQNNKSFRANSLEKNECFSELKINERKNNKENILQSCQVKKSITNSKGYQPPKKSFILQEKADQYQLQINTKIYPSTKITNGHSVSQYKQNTEIQNKPHQQFQQSMSFRNQKICPKTEKKSLSQSKKSSKPRSQGSFMIQSSVSKVEMNKQNSSLNIQLILHKPFQLDLQQKTPVSGENPTFDKKQNNRKSIIKNKSTGNQQTSVIKQQKGVNQVRPSIMKQLTSQPFKRVESKNYLRVGNQQCQKFRGQRISQDYLPQKMISHCNQGKLPVKSRFSISQSIQNWNANFPYNRRKTIKISAKDDLVDQILEKISLHLSALNLMAQFVIMTQQIYDEEQSDWTKIPSFIIYKKFFAERIKVANNLKGNFQKGSCFNIQDLQVTSQMLKDHFKDEKIKQKLKQVQQGNAQIQESIKQYYQFLMEEQQKYDNTLLNLQPFDDHYIGFLMAELNGQFEALEPKLEELDEGQDSEEAQVIIERLYRIMQLVFLLSELQGRRAKRYEQEFQVNAFQEYYQENYPLYRQTILYFN